MTHRKEPPKEGTIGRVIYDARVALDKSQAALARQLGTSRRNVIRWENNEVKPGAEYSADLADALNVPIEKILDPSVAHVRRNQDSRVRALLLDNATLRAELRECRRENTQLHRQIRRAS